MRTRSRASSPATSNFTIPVADRALRVMSHAATLRTRAMRAQVVVAPIYGLAGGKQGPRMVFATTGARSATRTCSTARADVPHRDTVVQGRTAVARDGLLR